MDQETKEYINQKYGLLLEDYVQLQNRVEELEQINQELLERISELEQITNPDPGSTDYDQLTKDQKVYEIRRKLVTLAENNNGHARMQYKDVQRLFDGHPSPGHCYDLMDRAGTADGFTYDQPNGTDGQKRIRVNIDSVNEIQRFHGANKATHESPA